MPSPSPSTLKRKRKRGSKSRSRKRSKSRNKNKSRSQSRSRNKNKSRSQSQSQSRSQSSGSEYAVGWNRNPPTTVQFDPLSPRLSVSPGQQSRMSPGQQRRYHSDSPNIYQPSQRLNEGAFAYLIHSPSFPPPNKVVEKRRQTLSPGGLQPLRNEPRRASLIPRSKPSPSTYLQNPEKPLAEIWQTTYGNLSAESKAQVDALMLDPTF